MRSKSRSAGRLGTVETRIRCDVDFDREGRQAGYLRAPCSRDDSGWGCVFVPIVVVKNGRGPTLLLTAGVHGDEYEGQIAVARFAQELDPARVQGRVIMLPAVNVPALLANTRLSPVDGRDLNRCFPGEPRGTFSSMLAHFLDAVILPLVDVAIDLHSAGHSAEAALSTNMHFLSDPDRLARTLALASAFGAPFNVVFEGIDEGATLTSAAERRGIVTLGTELGGWGRVNVEGVRVALRGIGNVLRHLGMLDGEPEPTPPTRHMMVRDPAAYVHAPADGLFEPLQRPGESVEAGALAGWLHRVEDVETAPVAVRHGVTGLVWMAAGPGRVRRGDVVAVVMTDYSVDARPSQRR